MIHPNERAAYDTLLKGIQSDYYNGETLESTLNLASLMTALQVVFLAGLKWIKTPDPSCTCNRRYFSLTSLMSVKRTCLLKNFAYIDEITEIANQRNKLS